MPVPSASKNNLPVVVLSIDKAIASHEKRDRTLIIHTPRYDEQLPLLSLKVQAPQ
jgi:hypothetical protein